jgi:hypothetical protein
MKQDVLTLQFLEPTRLLIYGKSSHLHVYYVTIITIIETLEYLGFHLIPGHMQFL